MLKKVFMIDIIGIDIIGHYRPSKQKTNSLPSLYKINEIIKNR